MKKGILCAIPILCAIVLVKLCAVHAAIPADPGPHGRGNDDACWGDSCKECQYSGERKTNAFMFHTSILFHDRLPRQLPRGGHLRPGQRDVQRRARQRCHRLCSIRRLDPGCSTSSPYTWTVFAEHYYGSSCQKISIGSAVPNPPTPVMELWSARGTESPN